MLKILVLHGPNLNLLGTREPAHYGADTLAEIDRRLVEQGEAAGVAVECFQSNAEPELIQRIHDAPEQGVNWLIFNPGAFTHTSVALRDAVLGVGLPFFEVHLSNVHSREPFRHHSYFSDIAEGVITGLGGQGYSYALAEAIRRLRAE